MAKTWSLDISRATENTLVAVDCSAMRWLSSLASIFKALATAIIWAGSLINSFTSLDTANKSKLGVFLANDCPVASLMMPRGAGTEKFEDGFCKAKPAYWAWSKTPNLKLTEKITTSNNAIPHKVNLNTCDGIGRSKLENSLPASNNVSSGVKTSS